MNTLAPGKLAAASIAVAFGVASAGALAEEMEMEGTLTAVDPAENQITVRLEDIDRDVTYSVDEDTRIDVMGNIGRSLEDLETGRHVILEFDDERRLGQFVILYSITAS